MKRDMDLIRQLMLNLENDAHTDPPGYEKDVITYHKALLTESELALGQVLLSDDRIVAAKLSRLTWQGHEFLDAARDETGWQHVTRAVGKTVGTVSLSLLQALLSQWAAGKLGIP